MATLYENLQGGTITDSPLTSGATTINSSAFQYLPEVTGGDIMFLTLDPEGSAGDPEIVKVTAHTAAATAVTVVRAQQDTTAREHLAATQWVHALTETDIGEFLKTVSIDDLTSALLEEICPAGTIRQTLKATADTGWVLDDQTIVGCDVTYPTLWANAPATMKSGSDLVIPDLAEVGLIGAGSFAALGEVAGSNTQPIAETNLASHTHASPAHVHDIGHGHADDIAITGGSHAHGDTISANQSGHVHAGSNTAGESMAKVRFSSAGSHLQLASGTSGWYLGYESNTESTDPAITISGGVSTSASHPHTVTGGVTDHAGDSGAFNGDAETGSTGGDTDLNIVSKSFGVRYQIKAH